MHKIEELDQVSAKITSILSCIQIICPDVITYRLVQNFLSENCEKVSFHTFFLLSEKSLKIVIRGLPLDISDDELSNELKLIGFEPQYVRPFIKNVKRKTYSYDITKIHRKQ